MLSEPLQYVILKLCCCESKLQRIKREHRSKLKTKNPKINRSYPVPRALVEPISKVIKEMLDTGILEPSISSYCSPLRIVQKPDGLPRICLDARQLNENIEDDLEGPPIISELMQDFHGCEIFSKN